MALFAIHHPMHFSVSSFNVCNLQTAGQQMFGEFAWTPAQYQRKVGWLAEQLRAQPASVMAFQEVWSAAALHDVLKAADLAERYDCVCHDSNSEMHVATAVHKDWEIISSDWIENFPSSVDWRSDDTRYRMAVDITQFSRPVLKVRLRHRDTARTLTVFNAHLKSRRPISPDKDNYYGVGADHWHDVGRALSGMRRLAEAAMLRVLVSQQLVQSNDAVIVAGDCNDRYPSNVTDLLKGDARFRRSANNRSGRRADWGLYHLLDLEKQVQRADVQQYITFCGDDELLALDHLFFSWHFHHRAAGSRWHLQDWAIHGKHLGHDKPHVSDHAMVFASFSEKSV
jgi:endonuclease/exonuclease/phosphatase family metal-dependent hydrolase